MRKFLASKVGHPVISFAYPFNYGAAYDSRGDYVLRAQQDAAYLSGRSTLNGPLNPDNPGEPLAMKTDAHFLAGRDRIEAAWQRASAGGQALPVINGDIQFKLLQASPPDTP